MKGNAAIAVNSLVALPKTVRRLAHHTCLCGWLAGWLACSLCHYWHCYYYIISILADAHVNLSAATVARVTVNHTSPGVTRQTCG
jgi:hypothetical protein